MPPLRRRRQAFLSPPLLPRHTPAPPRSCCTARLSRRAFLTLLPLPLLLPAPGLSVPAPAAPTTGFLSPTGLRYFDFVAGTGRAPAWGDNILVDFAVYTVSASGAALKTFESTFARSPKSVLRIHHGGGRMVLGFEEALHSMRVGGRRRVIVPPELAYVNPGLGPIPAVTRVRRKFFEELKASGGVVVFDLELVGIEDGDGDEMGYYKDPSPSPQELNALFTKIRDENKAKGMPQFLFDETEYYPDGTTYFSGGDT